MIYLDHAASAPLRPAARTAWLAASEVPGNAASPHAAGRRAAQLVERARARVAALAGRAPREVVFTSGATEANNMALLGAAAALEAAGAPRRLAISAVEHASVRAPAAALAARGWELAVLPVDDDGVVNDMTPAAGASMVSIMAVNNETGARQPLARVPGAVMHVDAVQAAGYLDLATLDADLVSLSAHKLGGPQGIGALLVRPETPLRAQLLGGAHERGRRAGTSPVAAIAAFGAACEEVLTTREAEAARLAGLRGRLAARVLAAVPGARALGRAEALAPQILCLVFPGLVGEALVEQLDMAGVAASTGAACTVLGEPVGASHAAGMPGSMSPVLAALGLDEASIQGSLRLSLGWSTTEDEVERAAAIVAELAGRLMTSKPMAT